MKYENFLKKVNNLPIIESEIFLAGEANPKTLKVQFSRWVNSGKLIQLRRGVYALPEIYTNKPHCAFYAANLIKRPSYISLEKAMEFYGLIPEAVNVYTSVTSKRAGHFHNEVGDFYYRHIHADLFWGYRSIMIEGQHVFMARPEKALLDFIYLNHIDVSREFLDELRLQNTDVLSGHQLMEDAKRFKKPVMLKRARILTAYIQDVQKEEKKL
ncbi:MAG: hypothetical protein ACLFPX_08330 [Candidatus Omnitrophota bacterium]